MRCDVRNGNIIEIKDLVKCFGEVKAVDGITFRVKRGEFFAFLGVNGAGKSTTIGIISGDIEKDSGEVFVCGYDLETQMNKIKSIIGIVYQNSYLDKNLTVYDNLKVKAGLYGIRGDEFERRYEHLSELLDFKELSRREFGKLSGGQKRKIDIARALIHEPTILILDEPTTGLDPQTRIKVWQVLNDLRREKGLTIFLTTHYMEEASECDYVVILDSGKIVAKGTPNELKNQYSYDYIRVYNCVSESDIAKIKDKYQCNIIKDKNYIQIEVGSVQVAKDMILNYASIFEDFEIIKGKMDVVFLNVTGKSIKEII